MYIAVGGIEQWIQIEGESAANPVLLFLCATKSLVIANQLTSEADTSAPPGKGEGFRTHELHEAALASSAAITLRMAANERGYKLESVSVEVDRSRPDETAFRTRIDLQGDISDTERKLLIEAAQSCPVRKTRSKRLSFTEPGMR